jgi:exonuclease VII large subunit
MVKLEVDTKDFTAWLSEHRERIIALSRLIGQAAPPEAQQGRESWLNELADRLSNSLQEVLELNQEAENYWLNWCAEQSKKYDGAPKSRLDLSKNIDCSERRVYKFTEAMLKTIETRTSLTQSTLKFYRSV